MLPTNMPYSMAAPNIQGTIHSDHTSVHPNYAWMLQFWRTAEDVRLGTPAIKSATTEYLPQETKETYDAYLRRLEKATFHPVSSKTISALVSLGLRKPVTLGTDAPAELQNLLYDIDLQGHNIDQFVNDVLTESLWKGHTFIWVDIQDDPEVTNREQLRNSGIRPYFVHVKPEEVINWRHKIVKGRKILTRAVIREYVEVENPDNEYIVTNTFQYRQYDLIDGRVEWKMFDANGAQIDNGVMNIDEIPLYPIYSRQIGTFLSMPLFYDMYNLNIRHYQVSSDRAYHLHLCAVPFLELKGIQLQEGQEVVISPNTAVQVPVDGGIKWVELEGKTLDQQLVELESLEMRMYSIGISIFGRGAVERRTATEATQDFYVANSDITTVMRNLKNVLEQAFDAASILYLLPTTGSVNISDDFDFGKLDPQELQAMFEAYKQTILPLEEVRKYMVRKQLTSEEFDVTNPQGTFYVPPTPITPQPMVEDD